MTFSEVLALPAKPGGARTIPGYDPVELFLESGNSISKALDRVA